MLILETENVSKRFGGLTAVNRVSLQVEEGEVFGLIGPNGAGKTTFLNTIVGRFPPSEGKVIFRGEETTALSAEAMCHKGMSRTFQIPRPFPQLTVLENVKIGVVFGSPKPNPTLAEERARELLDYVGFSLPVDTPAQQLNAVQLKRIDLARALGSKPKLLLLDELASGLSPGELDSIMELILKIRDQGVSIIAIEHIMRVIKGICDQVMVIEYGSTIAEGTPDEVLENPKVIEAYLGETDVIDS